MSQSSSQRLSAAQADTGAVFHSGEIDRAVDLLRNGDVVALPTETVYGLAGDGFNPAALAKIFAIKQRPFFDPLILHVLSLEAVNTVAESISPQALRLAEKFWPGPLTLILPKRANVPDLATSGLPTVAVRVPAHPLSRLLLGKFGGPLAAPSANRFGRLSPTTAEAVRQELGDAVPLILDGGPCQVGVESTIIDCTGERPVMLRAGGTPLEEIEALIGAVEHATPVSEKPLAPGHLEHHYAPCKPLRLIDSLDELSAGRDYSRTGLLALNQAPVPSFGSVRLLSPAGDLTEAAAQFFAQLRSLDDDKQIDQIIAVRLPSRGLGLAINERLSRARQRDVASP